MKRPLKCPRFPTLILVLAAALLTLGVAVASAAPMASAPVASAPVAATSAPTPEPAHVVTGPEIQSQLDEKVQAEAADRQAIRDLLARPDVRRIAGSAGLDLQRADAAVGTLSGAELSRLADQSRQVSSQLAGGDSITMTWTMLIIIVVALVVLIAVL